MRAKDIDSRATKFVLGIETVAVDRGPFRLLHRASLRVLDGRVDGFTESGPGVQMEVGTIDTDSWMLELGLQGEVDLSPRSTLTGYLGYSTNLGNNDDPVNGRYVGGGRLLSVNTPGINDNALILGLGLSLDHDRHDDRRLRLARRTPRFLPRQPALHDHGQHRILTSPPPTSIIHPPPAAPQGLTSTASRMNCSSAPESGNPKALVKVCIPVLFQVSRSADCWA